MEQMLGIGSRRKGVYTKYITDRGQPMTTQMPIKMKR